MFQHLGFLSKRRLWTGVFSRRYVTVSGGLLTWAKPFDTKTGMNVSCRSLSGAVVVEATGELQFARLNAGHHVFVVYFAYDAREVTVENVCLAAESDQEMRDWITAIRMAAGWLYFPPCMQPLPRRLSGLLVIELICVENVLAADWNGKSDPYILVEYDGQLNRTATQYRKLTAHFNYVTTLPVHNDDPNLTISMFVFDEDSLSSDDLLGGVSVPLHALGFNKEIVWDSVPLRKMSGSLHGRSSGTDQYGTISFRTLYRSSKVTQFLPKKQPQAVLSDETAGVNRRGLLDQKASSNALMDYERKARRKSSIALALSNHTDMDVSMSSNDSSEEEKSPKSPKSGGGESSPLGSPKMAGHGHKKRNQEEGRNEENAMMLDFSIEMFKVQIMRIVGFLKVFSIFKSLGYFFAWHDPTATLVQYAWITWICWLEPQSALMFWLILFTKLVVQGHPCYPDLVSELKGMVLRWNKRLLFSNMETGSEISEKNANVSASSLSMTTTETEKVLSPQGSVIPGTKRVNEEEYRVFECQRRRIAGAMTMLSTMVKVTTVVPAQMAVAAGTAVASPLLPRDVKQERLTEGAEKVTKSAKKDIENLFLNFSGKNLHANEHEWVKYEGVPLKESPATVIDGFKIKWTVMTRKKVTDKNGWEYARNFPSFESESGSAETKTSVEYNPKLLMWGHSSKFYSKLKIHRHWVRRRVWVGRPIRPAFQSEEPIKLSEIVEAVEDKGNDQMIDGEGKKARSLYAKFKQIMEEGKKLQNVLFGIASQLESIKNLFSWKSRWITSMMFWLFVIVLFASLLVSQFIILWAIVTFVLLDQLTDAQRKAMLMQPMLDALKQEVSQATTLPVSWKNLLSKKLNSFSANMVEITIDVPVSVLLPFFQRASDQVWFPNAVVLTLEDLDTAVDEGGPVTLGILLERIYLAANHGDADWWKSLKVSVHPKNLIAGHLVSDWEEYNPTSVFAK